jgi:mannosyltransferase OCH1-like enzyme
MDKVRSRSRIAHPPPVRAADWLLAVEIQRSNVIRYLILYKFGGIYLDLDIKCLKPMDFFLTVDWVSPPGLPVGINNAFMAAAPGHPFLKHTIDNVKRFDLNWISLYVTDM